MSDVIDVQNNLCALIESAVYPNSTTQPSVSGGDAIIYAGWPNSSTLDADLAAGKCHITVFPKGDERNTTRYNSDPQMVIPAATTLTATIAGATITIGGTVSTPQNVALIISGSPFVYAVQASDTLNTIAAALAALVAVKIAGTTSSGAVINIGPLGRIGAARVGGSATVAAEVRRQERAFQITVWANTPTARDTIGAALDVALAQVRFLTLPDGFAARLVYKNSPVMDGLQKANLYRRDFNYSVEYATTITSQAPVVIATTTNLSAVNGQTVTINQ